jgi:hypothetical protein
MHDRLAPGTGFGDTVGFVKMVRDAGVLPRAVGVEVISDFYIAEGAKSAAEKTYAGAANVLREVWPELLEK